MYEKAAPVFKSLMKAYETFSLENETDKFRKSLLKKIIVSSYGKLLQKDSEIEVKVCDSLKSFEKILTSTAEIVDIRCLSEDYIEVWTSTKTDKKQWLPYRNVILGEFLLKDTAK